MDINLIALAVLAAVVVFVVVRSRKGKEPHEVAPIVVPKEVAEEVKADVPTPRTDGTRQPCTIVKDGKEMKGEMDMAYGLRVWDENGNLTLDTNDRLVKVLGTFSTNGRRTGSRYDAKLSGGELWFVVTDRSANGSIFSSRGITVTASGTSLQWSFPREAEDFDATIIYGVW